MKVFYKAFDESIQTLPEDMGVFINYETEFAGKQFLPLQDKIISKRKYEDIIQKQFHKDKKQFMLKYSWVWM